MASYGLAKDYFTPIIFVLVGVITSFFSKNMLVILLIALVSSNIIKHGNNMRYEGFEGDEEGFEGEEEGFEGDEEGFEGDEEGFEGDEEGFEGFEGDDEGFEGFDGEDEGFEGEYEGFEGEDEGFEGGYEGFDGEDEGFDGEYEGFEGFEGDEVEGMRRAKASSKKSDPKKIQKQYKTLLRLQDKILGNIGSLEDSLGSAEKIVTNLNREMR
jgi:hypothetical protein